MNSEYGLLLPLVGRDIAAIIDRMLVLSARDDLVAEIKQKTGQLFAWSVDAQTTVFGFLMPCHAVQFGVPRPIPLPYGFGDGKWPNSLSPSAQPYYEGSVEAKYKSRHPSKIPYWWSYMPSLGRIPPESMMRVAICNRGNPGAARSGPPIQKTNVHGTISRKYRLKTVAPTIVPEPTQ